MKSTTLLLALLLPTATACVTGSDAASAGLAVGSVVVYSAVAQDAASDKNAPQSTASLWCGTLRITQGQRGLWNNQEHSDDEWAETLATSVYQLARDNGYALHRTQTRMLILDAKRVNEDPVALDQALKNCPSPS